MHSSYDREEKKRREEKKIHISYENRSIEKHQTNAIITQMIEPQALNAIECFSHGLFSIFYHFDNCCDGNLYELARRGWHISRWKSLSNLTLASGILYARPR